MKPLIQSEYKMQIIEDLGLIFPKDTSNKKYRYAMFKCNKCELPFKASTDNMRKRNREFCTFCETTVKPIKLENKEFIAIENLGIVDGRRSIKLKCKKCNTDVVTRSDYVNTIKCIKCRFKRLKKKQPRLYRIWDGMKQRCYNKNDKDYKYYGAKGITVCNEWINNFEAFMEWSLENGYRDDLTIDKDILCDELKISPKTYNSIVCQWITIGENSKYSNIEMDIKRDCNGRFT